MDRQAFERWLGSFARAWDTKTDDDRGAVEALFTNPARWHRVRSPAVIADSWLSEVATQTDVRTQWEVICVTDTMGIACLKASWVEKRTALVEGEGLFIVRLDEQGRAAEIDEWWKSRSTPLMPYA